MMGIKPFRLIKDLMGLGIFGNPSTVIDAEVVGKLCDIHGFVFEREKREKGGGVKPLPEVPKEPDPVPVVEEPKEVLKIRTPIITVMGCSCPDKAPAEKSPRKTISRRVVCFSTPLQSQRGSLQSV